MLPLIANNNNHLISINVIIAVGCYHVKRYNLICNIIKLVASKGLVKVYFLVLQGPGREIDRA